MAATQPMPMPPITPSGGGGAGNWFSTHKGLAIGGGIVGLLALYYLYTKMKSSSSGSSSGANVGSGSGTVQILTGTPASQSGTQSGMGEQAYYAQLQALQSGIDTQLQNQIASSGTGTSSYGSTGTGTGSSGTGTGSSTGSGTGSSGSSWVPSGQVYQPAPVVSTPAVLQGSGYTQGGAYGYQGLSNPSQAAAAYNSGKTVYYEPQPGVFQAVAKGTKLLPNTTEYIA